MPNLYATNKTSSTLTVTSCTVHFIDSTDASLVTVYDSNDAPCDAFQYSLSGIPWWYVLDGVHDAWVDDLSSIGYHLPTVLPTVSVLSYNNDEWAYLNTDKSAYSLSNNSKKALYFGVTSSTRANFNYDSSCSYAMIVYQTIVETNAGFTGLDIVANSSNYVSCLNVTGNTLSITRMKVAICSDSTATVVPVYDSSNVAYNAFKFTASGTDYYYVLDGTQTDWTDDLSSIGYSLTPTTQRAWLTTSGPHSDKYLNTGTEYSVVDSHDTHIPYDSTKTYILVGVYKINGTQVQGSFSLVSGGDGYGNTILKIVNNSTRTEVGYLDYYTT